MYKFNLVFMLTLLAIASGALAMEPASDQFNAQLLAATEVNDAPEVERLLALRPELTFMDEGLRNALQVAGLMGDEQVCGILCQQFAQSKVLGGTALMQLIERADMSIEVKVPAIKLLIECGCDVNSALIEHGDTDGWTALHFAAEAGNEEICTLLLDAGARIDVRDARGSTPLIESAKGSTLEYSVLLPKSLLAHVQRSNDRIMATMLCFNRLRYEGNECAQLLYKQFVPLLGRYFTPYVSIKKLLRVRDKTGRIAYDYTSEEWLNPEGGSTAGWLPSCSVQ